MIDLGLNCYINSLYGKMIGSVFSLRKYFVVEWVFFNLVFFKVGWLFKYWFGGFCFVFIWGKCFNFGSRLELFEGILNSFEVGVYC